MTVTVRTAMLSWFGLWAPQRCAPAISTSGNSSNVLNAVETAKAKSMHCIALSGRDGGALLEHCSPNIVVPETETFRIQEYHLPDLSLPLSRNRKPLFRLIGRIPDHRP